MARTSFRGKESGLQWINALLIDNGHRLAAARLSRTVGKASNSLRTIHQLLESFTAFYGHDLDNASTFSIVFALKQNESETFEAFWNRYAL